MAAELRLDVVTPEKAMVKNQVVESVILPGEMGQMNVLPGHMNLITGLTLGSFAYKVGGEWKWAYIGGGFAEVRGQNVRILAETMDLAHEIDVANSELQLQTVNESLKKTTSGTAEYSDLQRQKTALTAKIALAKKQN